MIRTHEAGALRADDAGADVVLTGWVARRRDHGGVVFVDLRDSSGVVQVVFRPEVAGAVEGAHDLRAEYCIAITGTVAPRPAGNENPELPTGAIEVTAKSVEVLSESTALPFQLEGQSGDVDEAIRLRYRYLDLRRPAALAPLLVRAQALRVIRAVMDEHRYVEVETPTLTRSTPEGARDYLVPCRQQPGTWYALPQSPQLFKQLLMVGGLERYYQIARCYRDEDTRADRQPEFTQLDIELSFPDEEDLYALTEELIVRLWREVLGVELETPFPRMTYAESMTRFGNDKPDMRFGDELIDLRTHFADTGVGVFKGTLDAGGHVGAVLVRGGATLTRKELDAWVDWAKGRGGKGLAWVAIEPDGSLRSPLAKFFSEAESAGFAAATGASPGDLVFLVADARPKALALLGALRLAVARERGLVDESLWRFLWVTEAPMFEGTDGGGWTAVHHPFTAPTPEWEARFTDDPEHALARAYDLVGNGMELGGGSIRIHRRDVQQRVFDVIGLTPDTAREQFGFLLDAFDFGPPPHGGIAFGIDRLTATLAGTDAIRDVIAFPKTASGADPLTGAPTPITAAQRKEAGIDAKPAIPGG